VSPETNPVWKVLALATSGASLDTFRWVQSNIEVYVSCRSDRECRSVATTSALWHRQFSYSFSLQVPAWVAVFSDKFRANHPVTFLPGRSETHLSWSANNQEKDKKETPYVDSHILCISFSSYLRAVLAKAESYFCSLSLLRVVA